MRSITRFTASLIAVAALLLAASVALHAGAYAKGAQADRAPNEAMTDSAEGVSHLLNINTATAEELAATLSGVGMSRAEAIVAYRTEHGHFSSLDGLTAVKGIGAKTLEQNRHLLTVSAGKVDKGK